MGIRQLCSWGIPQLGKYICRGLAYEMFEPHDCPVQDSHQGWMLATIFVCCVSEQFPVMAWLEWDLLLRWSFSHRKSVCPSFEMTPSHLREGWLERVADCPGSCRLSALKHWASACIHITIRIPVKIISVYETPYQRSFCADLALAERVFALLFTVIFAHTHFINTIPVTATLCVCGWP